MNEFDIGRAHAFEFAQANGFVIPSENVNMGRGGIEKPDQCAMRHMEAVIPLHVVADRTI
nr:hypothetical protein [Gluconacetobacter takamatsuzukensis]